MKPVQVKAPYDWSGLRDLISTAFAGMDGRVDPPSSIHRLTSKDIERQAQAGEIWVIGDPPVASVFLMRKGDALYIGKLAVAESARRQGLARLLLETAAIRAHEQGLTWLELQTRIELTENHAAFRAMGFTQTGTTAHPGFDRPTSLTFRKAV